MEIETGNLAHRTALRVDERAAVRAERVPGAADEDDSIAAADLFVHSAPDQIRGADLAEVGDFHETAINELPCLHRLLDSLAIHGSRRHAPRHLISVHALEPERRELLLRAPVPFTGFCAKGYVTRIKRHVDVPEPGALRQRVVGENVGFPLPASLAVVHQPYSQDDRDALARDLSHGVQKILVVAFADFIVARLARRALELEIEHDHRRARL